MPRDARAAPVDAVEDAASDLAARALRLLAAREHSVAELRRKLRRGRSRGGTGAREGHGTNGVAIDDDMVEAVLATLQRDGLLSDARFAEAFVHGRIGRGQGPAKIRAGLMERGVARELVEDALDLDGDFWTERAREAHAKRFGATPPTDRAGWAKRARFLAARGFGAEVVYRTLGEQPV